MKQYNILTRIMSAIILLLCIMGCTDESIISGVIPAENKITVKMTIPGLETPMLTRSGEDRIWERKIEEVDLMFFDDSSPSELIKHVHINQFSEETWDDDHFVLFHLVLGEGEDLSHARTVVTVANAHDKVMDVLGIFSSNTIPKTDLLNNLKFQSSRQWETSASIPMYGETYVHGIYKGVPVPYIKMKRMLARIDVENKVNGSIFKLEKIHLANYRTSGFIAPAWSHHTGLIIGEQEHTYPYSRNMDPMVPSGFTVNPPIEYSYSQYDNLPGPLMEGLIYTYEAPKATPNEKVCLVLEGLYKGVHTYYRVDFTSDREAHEDYEVFRGDDVPLYRNHKYVVAITAAEGVGYPTFQEAINASSVLSNLKTTVHIVDMTGINRIVYDGQYFMGIEKKVVDIPWNADKELIIRISCDYRGSWEAEILNPAGASWLSFANNEITNRGENLSGLDLRIKPANIPSNGYYPTGQVVFSTGRLRDTLTIRRVTMTEMFAHSNIISLGGRLTFATNEEDLVAINKNMQGVFFKWGSLYPIAPAGNPYVSPIYGSWENIPYAHQSFNFTTPATRREDDDAFKTYNNNLGFDKEANIGDICRYISNGNYWAGGKWRLPTQEELNLLYAETDRRLYFGSFFDMKDLVNSFPDNFKEGCFNMFGGLKLGIGAENDLPGTIHLPASGIRSSDSNAHNLGIHGFYWSSTPGLSNSNYACNLLFDENVVAFYEIDRSYAFPVRCVRDY